METNCYHPRELEEAAVLSEEQEGMVLVSDGPDIILGISADKITPTGIIDICSMESMNAITNDGQYVHIGGNVTYRQMQDSPVYGRIGGLARAVGSTGSPVIRMVATLVDNIATAASSANRTSTMLALDTELVLVNVRGERIVRQKNIHLGAYKINIQSNETIKEMWFSSSGPDKGNGYARLSRRKSRNIIKVIAGVVAIVGKKGRYLSAVISLGILGVTAVLASSVGEGIKGYFLHISPSPRDIIL